MAGSNKSPMSLYRDTPTSDGENAQPRDEVHCQSPEWLIREGVTCVHVQALSASAAVVVHERDEADSIVRGWAGRPWGKRAIQEIVATLTDNHTEEVLEATKESTGGFHADLIEIIRNDKTRELYTLLVTRMAREANAANG